MEGRYLEMHADPRNNPERIDGSILRLVAEYHQFINGVQADSKKKYIRDQKKLFVNCKIPLPLSNTVK